MEIRRVKGEIPPKPSEEHKYLHVDVLTHKYFWSKARNQRFEVPENAKKYRKLKESERARNEKNRDSQRIKARAHELGRMVYEDMVLKGERSWKCEISGEEDRSQLQIHHRDKNYLNNSPENLQCVSIVEHSKIHEGE